MRKRHHFIQTGIPKCSELAPKQQVVSSYVFVSRPICHFMVTRNVSSGMNKRRIINYIMYIWGNPGSSSGKKHLLLCITSRYRVWHSHSKTVYLRFTWDGNTVVKDGSKHYKELQDNVPQVRPKLTACLNTLCKNPDEICRQARKAAEIKAQVISLMV